MHFDCSRRIGGAVFFGGFDREVGLTDWVDGFCGCLSSGGAITGRGNGGDMRWSGGDREWGVMV